MTANAVIAGTFADLRSVKSRSVVILHIEVPIERAADVVAMFGYPQPGEEVSVAVARLVQPVAEQPPAQATERRKWDELRPSQQAGIACNEPEFWEFLTEVHDNFTSDANKAAAFVRWKCGVRSRSEFDTDEAAASRWNTLHGEYLRWRADRVGQEQAEAQAREYGRT